MTKLNERKFLTWGFFNTRGMDGINYGICGFVGFWVWLIFIICMTDGPLFLPPAIFVPLGIIMFVVTTVGIPNLDHLHVLHSIKEPDYRGRGGDLWKRGMEYLALPAEDKALYPANIIDIIKNPDLERGQKYKLERAMGEIYRSIEERNSQKARVERELRTRHIDVNDVVSRLKDSMESVSAETSVWTEERRKLESSDV